MSQQLNMFDQLNKQAYRDHFNRFYSKQLREAAERRKKRKEGEPTEVIMISTGGVRPLTTNDLKLKKV